jgi:hypothetical protein
MTYIYFNVVPELAETLSAVVDEFDMLEDESDKARLIARLNSALEPD